MNEKHMVPLLSTFVLWGSVYIASKIALRTIPPVMVLTLRYVVSIPALALVLALGGRWKRPTREQLVTAAGVGFVGYFLSFCLQMLAIDRLSGSISSLLGAMNPIFIPVLAAIFLKERLTLSRVLCVAVSMAGVVAVAGVNGEVDARGVALMLVSVLLWSATSVFIRRRGAGIDPIQLTMLGMAFALPLTGAWALVENAPCSFTMSGVLAVLYMGLAGTAAAHSLWNYSLSKMDAGFCAMFYPLQPLVSAVLGVLLLGERVTPGFLLGGALICCGIVAAALGGRTKVNGGGATGRKA